MSRPHEELREALGAHVLGQLGDDPALRHDVEEHLSTCAACRAEVAELAPLAGALREVDPAVVGAPAPPPPASLDRRVEALLGGAVPLAPRTPGRRRVALVAAAAGALVGAAAATGLVLALDDDPVPAGPVVVALPSVSAVDGVQASAGLVDHTWGVEVRLTVEGLPADRRYDVRVVDAAGTEHDAGEFVSVAGTIRCNMSSSVLLEDAERFTVVDPEGRTVVEGPIES